MYCTNATRYHYQAPELYIYIYIEREREGEKYTDTVRYWVHHACCSMHASHHEHSPGNTHHATLTT
jgi:hypothetical protein